MSKERNPIQSIKEKLVIRRNDALKYPTDRLGPGSLMVQQSHINSSRVIMVNHQITHAVNIKDPETPLVPTGFENTLASYSHMIDRTDGDYEIVAKFVKNRYNYILIGYDKKRKHYHAWKRVELEEHSEGFSTKFNNSYIDSLEIGDDVPSDTVITKSDSFDKHMNYRYGKNLNTVYLVSAQILEDGILIMNNADHMMNTFRRYKQVINLADNELLLNWYGDDDHYQAIPKIGEKTKKGIIAVVRRVDNSKAPYALKKKKLQSIERGDRRYFGEGRIIDIDILYNKERDKLIDVGANKEIHKIYDEQQEYYKKLYKYMRGVIDRASDDGYTYSDEFSAYCMEAYDFIDASAYFADSNDNVFGNMQIVLHLMDEEKLIVGSKLVGRSGNKGVISRILPPEESWHMEDGTPIHVVVATLGIIGRLNQSQMNEHSINELSSTAIEMMKMTDDPDRKLKIVYNLMKYLNSDEADDFKKYTKKLGRKEKEKFCKTIERDGIFIVQDPIDNANIMDIAKAYEQFPPKWQRIVFPDGKKSMHKLLCAKMFYMRLKQDPLEKYSVRSRGPVNPLTTLPAKSNMKKKGLEPFSDVPVRLGEYEMEVLLAMVDHPDAVAAFMTENSTSWPAKMIMAEHNYLGDLDIMNAYDLDEDEMEDPEVLQNISTSIWEEASKNLTGRKNMESIAAHMNVLSARIEMDIEEAEDDKYFMD